MGNIDILLVEDNPCMNVMIQFFYGKTFPQPESLEA